MIEGCGVSRNHSFRIVSWPINQSLKIHSTVRILGLTYCSD